MQCGRSFGSMKCKLLEKSWPVLLPFAIKVVKGLTNGPEHAAIGIQMDLMVSSVEGSVGTASKACKGRWRSNCMVFRGLDVPRPA